MHFFYSLQLRESVSNATAALEYGIEHEADQDAALDWFAKFNLLIFPTKSAVAAATGARTLADSEFDVHYHIHRV